MNIDLQIVCFKVEIKYPLGFCKLSKKILIKLDVYLI